MQAADAAAVQQQLQDSLAAAQHQDQHLSKRARLNTGPQTVGDIQQAQAAVDASLGDAAAAGRSMSPSKRAQRKQQPGQQDQLMSPPPPVHNRQQPKRQQHAQSPVPQAKQAQQQQLQSPHKHGTRAAMARAAAAAAAPCAMSPSLSAISELAAVSSTAAGSAAGDTAAAADDDSEAICLRTRSKHPIAEQEFDPDMFDRLLAEFDPDLEPLLDEEFYQQFLQVGPCMCC